MDINISKAFNYLNHENELNITKRIIRRLYYELRKIRSKYFKISYQGELLGNLNANRYYSIDESLINHYHAKQVWLLVITDNINKDFRVECTF